METNMENSFDSNSPEMTAPALKSILKNHNFDAAFEVSMNESPTLEIDKSIANANTSKSIRLFKRKRKSIQGLNVSAHESVINSESEESHVFAKPRSVFARKQAADSFNVTFAESITGSNIMESFSEKSVLARRNPFRQSNKNDLSFGVGKSDETDVDNQITFADSDENIDSTTFLKKVNPFMNSGKNVEDNFEVSRNDSVRTGKDGGKIGVNSSTEVVEKGKSTGDSSKTRDLSHLSQAEEQPFGDSQRDKSGFTDKETSSLSINISKPRSESYVNESSINDENLNDWMSDQSEDEVSPPTIPTVTKNTSTIQEKPQKTLEAEKSPERPNWEDKVKEIMSQASKKRVSQVAIPSKPKAKKTTSKENEEKKYKPKLIKPAPFVTKRLYGFILKKFKPKYGVDAMIEAEDMVSCICDTVKKVLRRKAYQKALIQSLKKKMAKAELIETTMDFYEFVIGYLPYDFRVKVVPCLQPITNIVYPPKDGNPFDKIL